MRKWPKTNTLQGDPLRKIQKMKAKLRDFTEKTLPGGT